MAAVRKKTGSDAPARPPATTPEGRELQLISAAYDLVEQQIADGTVSAQVLSYLIKLPSEREKLERDNLRLTGRLLHNRAEQISSGKRMEELYGAAIDAMRMYGGVQASEDDYED